MDICPNHISMPDETKLLIPPFQAIMLVLTAVALFLSSNYNFLLFHTLAELFSVIISIVIFVIAWNSRKLTDNSYLLFIGVSSLFVGTLDFVHVLVYNGMHIITGYRADIATQLWILARLLQSASLFLAFRYMDSPLNPRKLMAGYSLLTLLFLYAAFHGGIIPVCFVEGAGVTAFKKGIEYSVCLLFAAAAITLYKSRKSFDPYVFRALLGAFIVYILMELSFTLYLSAFGFFNQIGHILKIIASFLVYRAIVETGFKRPFELIFRNLKQSEEALAQLNENLEERISERTVELQNTNTRLEREVLERTLAEKALHDQALLLEQEIAERQLAQEELAAKQKQLESLNSELEQRVFERTSQLERANHELGFARDAAEAATRAKSEFLANMSHEIRTPMNAVMGMIHLALQTELTPRQKEFLHKAHFAADSLLGIINDILDFSKIEAGKLEMEQREFVLQDVLDKVTAIIGMKSHEKGLEFMLKTAPDVPSTLVGDPLRLGQILINLCNNAVKFTDKGEILLITVKLAGQSDGQVSLRFSVRDTGIGMTEEQAGRLFLPFSQVDTSSTRKYGGTGLGLAICRQLVELMGGSIWVKSTPGAGSEFFFTASFGVGDLQKLSKPEASPELQGVRILVVDDSEAARNILYEQLSCLGFEAARAASGAEALHSIEQAQATRPFHLVLLDWKMPDMDGFETARRISSMSALTPVPKIVMVSAYGNDEIRGRVEAERLAGYLTKPVSPSSLFDVIMTAFGKEATPPSSAHTEEASIDLSGARLLLVEDNDFNQQVALEMLTSAGADVTIAENGAEAVAMVRNQPFDAVLMDLQMPVMDGWEATRHIKSETRFAHLPVIAMTAHAMEQHRARCLAAGMDDYIKKPINPRELYTVLRKWIATRSAPTGIEPADAFADSSVRLPVMLPGIDIKAGLTCMNNNPSFYRDMLLRFMNSKGDVAWQIKEKLIQGDRNSAVRMAHSMKSTAGSIGAETLMASAAALENILDQPDEPFASQLADFELKLAEVITGLEAVFTGEPTAPAPEPPSGKPADPHTVKVLVETISSLLEKDMVQSLALLDNLRKLLQGTTLGNRFKKLEQQLDKFDVDGARTTLVDISGALSEI